MNQVWAAPKIVVIGIFLATQALASAAPGDIGRVVIVEATSDTIGRDSAAANLRVKGELVAAGFAVEIARQPIGADARPVLEAIAVQRDAVAAFAIVGGRGNDLPEIWVNVRASGTLVVQKVSLEEGRADRRSAVLAVRAVEILRASLVEIWPTPLPPEAAPNPLVVVAPAPSPAAGPTSAQFLTLGAGPSVLHNFGGPGPAFLPTIGLGLSRDNGWGARFTVAGLGTSNRVTANQGDAKVQQALALIEIVHRFSMRRIFTPFMVMGAGVMQLTAQGQGLPPDRFRGTDVSLFVFTLAPGAGLSLDLTPRFRLVSSLQAVLTVPHTILRIVDVEVARVGRPSLIGALGIEARL